MAKAFRINGQLLTDFQINNILQDFAAILKQRYKTLTIAEIEYAFDNGALGRYGQVYGLNVNTFVSWLDAYLASEDHRWLMNNRPQQFAISEKATITQEQKDRECYAWCIAKFNEYKQTGKLSNPNGVIFDILSKAKRLILKPGTWDKYLSKASADVAAMPKNTPLLELIDRNKSFEVTAKKMLIKDYFDSLIASGK